METCIVAVTEIRKKIMISTVLQFYKNNQNKYRIIQIMNG